MKVDTDDIAFVPVTFEHLDLLETWMSRPHWRRWWGDPESELAEIRNMVEGRDTTKPFLFTLGGEPAGYIQCWFAGDWLDTETELEAPWLRLLPAGAVGVDLSIAGEGELSRGIGSAVLKTFVDKLVARGYRDIIIDPDPANRRAVRAYEKAGFRIIPELAGKTGDSLIMKLDMTTVSKAA